MYYAIGLLVVIIIFGSAHYYSSKRNYSQIFGVSFNEEYSAYLGLEPKKVFSFLLEDLNFKYLRLSAQWESIEKQPGAYDFSSLDWYMDEAAKKGAKVVLVVGQKIPRWPECHPPSSTKNFSDEQYFAALKNFVAASVSHYKNHPALEIWQVENEPFLTFGVCRKMSKQTFDEEIKMVREIDPAHKILVTESGELNLWLGAGKRSDFFGTTMYRVVWNKRIGYFSYDWLSPLFYRFKLWLSGVKKENAFVSELQAEPWIPDTDVKYLDLKEQYKSMSIKRFNKNIDYSRRVGFPRAYLWGAEWWYWMKEVKGVPDFADFAKTLKKE